MNCQQRRKHGAHDGRVTVDAPGPGYEIRRVRSDTLQAQRERYKDNPLIQKEIEQEIRCLLEILRERGGFL